MYISLERTGGFAGMHLKKTVDTANLPADRATKLCQGVEAVDFFDLPSEMTSPIRQPDRFQYKLTVAERGKQHTVLVSEQAASTKLRSLVQSLIEVRNGLA